MAGSKKNIIPLVLAVILALAAVFAVNRLIGEKTSAGRENMIEVLVAARPLAQGEIINEGAFTKKNIPQTAAPSQAILWKQQSMILNLKVKSAIAEGDYIVFDDIGESGGLSDMVGEREWAVSISLNGGAITKQLRPGDEIAIIGTFTLREVKKSPIAGQQGEETTRRITTVILPQVRILGLDGNKQQGGDEFILALPPAQAQMLIAAQAQGVELAPALRKPHDENNVNRISIGYTDADTFNALAEDLERTTIPAVPNDSK